MIIEGIILLWCYGAGFVILVSIMELIYNWFEKGK
jgi:hypothetical protein